MFVGAASVCTYSSIQKSVIRPSVKCTKLNLIKGDLHVPEWRRD